MRLRQEAEPLEERIADLQAVLRETRSEDVRQMIEAAIGDCERRLAALHLESAGQGALDRRLFA